MPKTPDEVRLDVLDELAEDFKGRARHIEEAQPTSAGRRGAWGYWEAYRRTRDYAHEHGIHLTSCKEGRRVGDSRRRWDDEETTTEKE